MELNKNDTNKRKTNQQEKSKYSSSIMYIA